MELRHPLQVTVLNDVVMVPKALEHVWDAVALIRTNSVFDDAVEELFAEFAGTARRVEAMPPHDVLPSTADVLRCSSKDANKFCDLVLLACSRQRGAKNKAQIAAVTARPEGCAL
jgi:hypothetical protein